jgi:hypothetical protein
VLITGNRNKDGPRSLEAAIQQFSEASSLPVLTVSEPNRIITSPDYAHRVVERLLEYLVDVENFRGTGQLFLP